MQVIGQRLSNTTSTLRASFPHSSERIKAEIRLALERITGIANMLSSDSTLSDQQALDALIRQGWYPHSEMHYVSLPKLAKGSPWTAPTTEKWMVKYYSNARYAIEQEVWQAYPERKDAVIEANYAHNNRQYALSTPLLLIQANGIWMEKHGESMFNRAVRNAAGTKAPNATIDPRDRISTSLFTQWPLILKEKEKKWGEYREISAIQVLSGRATQYATKVNSLKAFAYLGFIISQ